jgi:Leucine-rich repeat (LRR) protein
MQYLISKNDLLLSFSLEDINLLARYYRLPRVNRNDLLWLIAISNLSNTHQYAEMAPSKAWADYGSVLLMRFSNDDSAMKYITTESLPKEIIDADPTNNKKYLQWITTSYLDGGIKRFEDMGRVNTALKEYMYLLGRKLITNSAEQNINAFCGLSGCKQGEKEKIGLDEFLDRYEDKLKALRKKEEIQIAEHDAIKIFESDNLLVIQPLAEEASCKYGAGTKWCTAGRENNMFAYYSKKGPIYILIPKKPKYAKEKYQIQVETKQYMNEEDKEVNYNHLINRFPELKNIKEFSDWISMEELYLGRINTTFFTNIVRLNIKKELPELTLKDLFKVLENNKNLEQLTIKNKSQLTLPDSIGNFINLRKLDLRSNKLTLLPNSIRNFTNLQNLYLQYNKLISLPNSMGNLSSLVNLNLEHNKLTSLPDSIGNLSSLVNLNLEHNKLTSLPDSMENLSSLVNLNLEHNKLTSLPNSIGNLSSLKDLHLYDNKLTSLPNSMWNLSSLVNLDLENNQLASLPNSMWNLSSLTHLNLEHNKLTSLPNSIGNLSSLKDLHLYDNKLTSLPNSMGNLSSLVKLDLDNNQLASLPDSIGNLSSLKDLTLSKNPIKCFPLSLKSKNVRVHFNEPITYCA